jgi:hypothetical protein
VRHLARQPPTPGTRPSPTRVLQRLTYAQQTTVANQALANEIDKLSQLSAADLADLEDEVWVEVSIASNPKHSEYERRREALEFLESQGRVSRRMAALRRARPQAPSVDDPRLPDRRDQSSDPGVRERADRRAHERSHRCVPRAARARGEAVGEDDQQGAGVGEVPPIATASRLLGRDVDFSKRLIHVRRSYVQRGEGTPKSGRVRSVPMIDQVARPLDELSRREWFTGDDLAARGHLSKAISSDTSLLPVEIARTASERRSASTTASPIRRRAAARVGA